MSEVYTQRIQTRFGSLGFLSPANYLVAAGYAANLDGSWTPKPGVTGLKDMTNEEFECLFFLHRHHGFGGLDV